MNVLERLKICAYGGSIVPNRKLCGDAYDEIARLTAERDQALAEAAAAYERAAQVAYHRESHAKGETARACRGIAVSIGMLSTEPGTTALAEMLDAETRACAEVMQPMLRSMLSRGEAYRAILARIDQRKEAGE